MVKRVLREAARHGAGRLAAAAARQRVDVLFRLKAPLPDAATTSWAQVRLQLRREADSLIDQLQQQLQAHAPGRGLAAHGAGVPT